MSSAQLHRIVLLAVVALIVVDAREIVRLQQQNVTQPQAEATEQLLSVQLVFRHGDRTPYWIYKNDPYGIKYYPEGEGNLINRGKDRMYRYGQKLKERYAKYIKNLPLQNVQSESSPIRRCIESSLAVLAGFFPPSHADPWSSEPLSKIWQPVAVKTTEDARSWKLNPDAPCPTAERIDKEMESSNADLKKFLTQNAEFISLVGNYTGEKYDPDHLRWLYVGYLYDTLFTEQMYFGDRWVAPDWIEKVGNDTWARLRAFNDMVFTIYGEEPAFLKLRAGAFLKSVIDNFKKQQTQITTHTVPIPDSKKQLVLYGSHDTMEAYILHVLGLYRDQPTYGSGLIFELRQLPHLSEPTVHLWYANLTDNAHVNTTNNFDIYQLNLNESTRFNALCKEAYCGLSSFTVSLKDFVLDNPEQACKL